MSGFKDLVFLVVELTVTSESKLSLLFGPRTLIFFFFFNNNSMALTS